MNQVRAKDHRHTMSAGTLIGDSVKNRDGEKLGTLKEIMIDVDRRELAYGVLDFGGFMNMGDKYFAVPFEKFRVDEKDHQLLLDVDKDTLKNAEGFDKNDWPDVGDPQWGRQIHQHYGTTPSWDR